MECEYVRNSEEQLKKDSEEQLKKTRRIRYVHNDFTSNFFKIFSRHCCYAYAALSVAKKEIKIV